MSTIIQQTFRGGRTEVQDFVRRLPAMLAGRVPDRSQAVKKLQALMARKTLEIVQDAFEQKSQGGTDESGDRWQPLARSTVRRKKGRGGVLVDTGRLQRSLSLQRSGHKVVLTILQVGRGFIAIGTRVPYAVYHHKGTNRLPQRRLWPALDRWPRRWWQQIGQALSDGLAELLKEALS